MVLKEIFDMEWESHKSSGKFSISGVGGCWRQKYLELKGLYKKKYDQKTLRTFAIGDAFHMIATKAFFEKSEQAGIAVVAAEVNIPEGPETKNISGRTDAIISHQATGELNIVDFKSCSSWTMKKVKEGDIAQNYKDQVNLYLHFFKIKKGYLLFISKDKGEIAEVLIEYDPVRAKQVIKEIDDFYENYVNKSIEPPPCSGNSFGCEVCGYTGSWG